MYARFKNINIFNILTTMISNVFVFPFSKRIAISIKSKSNFETFHLSTKIRKRTIFYENRFS